jgi:hypothetical protein
MATSVEEAREVLRQAAERSSVRAVARAADVDHTGLNAFIRGETKKPRGELLHKLLRHAERLRADPAKQPHSPPPERGDSRTGTSAVTGGPGVTTVELPLHQLTYWRGIVESEWRHLGNTSRALEALLGMLNDATRGIGSFVKSGVLPEPTSDLTPEEEKRLAEIREAIEARRRRERGEAGGEA